MLLSLQIVLLLFGIQNIFDLPCIHITEVSEENLVMFCIKQALPRPESSNNYATRQVL